MSFNGFGKATNSHGDTYEGTWKDQRGALKTLFDPRVDKALKQEYMDELLVMSKLSHPNIVGFIGACTAPPDLCFVCAEGRCEGPCAGTPRLMPMCAACVHLH